MTDKLLQKYVSLSSWFKSFREMVKMLAPKDQDDWFHLLVWHQNRATRGVKNFIPDDSLPDFLDLVIWGHEHDCRIKPEKKMNNVHVCQPGSSVATSLAAGEAIPKHVGLLKIHKKSFQMIPIELKTVRPFVFEELVLKEVDQMKDDNSSMTPNEITIDLVTRKVNSMIEEAKNLGRIQRVSERPLIRLNVKARDERQVFNTIRFGQSYVGQVANPEDMIKCNVIRQPVRRGQNDIDGIQLSNAPILAERVEDIVLKYFADNDTFKCLPIGPLNESVKKFIDANDTEAPALTVDHLIAETVKYLEENMPEIEDTEKAIYDFKLLREKDSLNSVSKLLNDPDRSKKRIPSDDTGTPDDEVVTIEDDDDYSSSSNQTSNIWGNTTASKPTRGPGSRGGRGSRRAKAGRGRAK